MSRYLNVLGGQTVDLDVPPPQKRSVAGLGCAGCPSNIRKVKKIKGLTRITGRRIFVWAQCPGQQENDKGLELVGPAGRLLWEELEEAGVSRDDCDVQNVVRCWPVTTDSGKLQSRDPSKDELKCCSIFTDRALELNKGKAKLHLVFGQIAAKQLLGREYKKDRPVFWSTKLQARVACLDHPSYFLRGAPRYRWQSFRQRLRAALQFLELARKQYSYLEAQDYRLIKRSANVRKILRRAKASGVRISIDIEDGIVDTETGQAAEEGVRVILVLGLSWEEGVSWVIVLDHPENVKASRKEKRKVLALLKLFLEDPTIEKTFHHGSSDVMRLREVFGIKVKGYHFDTNYSTYFQWPAQQKYGLDEHSRVRVVQFANYKQIVLPHLDPEYPNYATIPLSTMRLYNGGDCDLSKRLEVITQEQAGPLLRMYTKVAFLLDDMQTRGPFLDKDYLKKCTKIIPVRLERADEELKVIAGDPDFNPASTQQVAKVMYDRLKIPLSATDRRGNSIRSTDKEILKLYTQRFKRKRRGRFCQLVLDRRRFSRMVGTYMDNYEESAKMNDGMVLTKWWLTGTRTGRLASGGGGAGFVNMQNLHGDPLLKNLLVSDLKWRLVTKQWSWIKQHLNLVLPLIVFLCLDYSQMELRVLAEMSGDPELIRLFQAGYDIHSAVGSELTGIPRDVLRNDEKKRTEIKSLHFGIIYGMSKKSLHHKLVSEGVKISRGESDDLYNKYFRKYKRVREFIESCREFVAENGYTETLFGFQRPVSTDSSESQGGSFWGNVAINSPIQGTAHQLLLCGMATLSQHPVRYNRLSAPVMEVHDSLVFYNQVQDIAEAFKQGRHLMVDAVPEYVARVFKKKLHVPFAVEAKIGFRYGVMTKYSERPEPVSFLKQWRKTNRSVEEKINQEWQLVTE